jgi:hypothetical protein
MKRTIFLGTALLLTGTSVLAQKPEAAYSGYSPGYTGSYVGYSSSYNPLPAGSTSRYSDYHPYFYTNGFRTVEEENRLMAEIEAYKKRERDREENPLYDAEIARKAREARERAIKNETARSQKKKGK